MGANTGVGYANNYALNLLGLDGYSLQRGCGVAVAWRSGDERDPGSWIQAARVTS